MIGQSSLFIALALLAAAHALPPKKIVGGNYARKGEFPYQVSLRYRGHHICGGTIISDRHILTAAHCFDNVRYTADVTVVTGTLSSTRGGEKHTVSKITIRPGWQGGVAPNDIALISLRSPIQFNNVQNKIDLPSASTPDGVTATVSGWGISDMSTKQNSEELMKLSVKIITADRCQQYWDSERIYREQVCGLHSDGRGVCQGDSGGPLTYNGEVIGIVSFVIPCGVGVPDVYTSVYHYISWIKRTMAET